MKALIFDRFVSPRVNLKIISGHMILQNLIKFSKQRLKTIGFCVSHFDRYGVIFGALAKSCL